VHSSLLNVVLHEQRRSRFSCFQIIEMRDKWSRPLDVSNFAQFPL
jgi:hypothetical protein